MKDYFNDFRTTLIPAIMARIKSPKITHRVVIFLTKVRSPGQTESQVDPSRILATPFGQALRALELTCDDLHSL